MNNKSFITWVGSKYNIKDEIIQNFPLKYNTYIEPFLGSGSIFFNCQKDNSILVDSNIELINTYIALKDNPNKIIETLLSFPNNEKYFNYLKTLDSFDNYFELDYIYRAARFIYINRYSKEKFYNVNENGFCINSYKNYIDNSFDFAPFHKCSNLLSNAKILNENYQIILNYVKENDLVYLDPPYDGKYIFHYNKDQKFLEKEQLELKEFCDKLTKKNVFFIQSNNDTNLIRTIYKEYNILEIKEIKRTELLIKNF